MKRVPILIGVVLMQLLGAQSPPQDNGVRVIAATSAASNPAAQLVTIDLQPGINNVGDVAFVGRLNGQAGEQVLLLNAATGSATPSLSAVTFAGSANRDFGGAAIANRVATTPARVASRDRVSGAPPVFTMRTWTAGAGSTLGQSPAAFESVSFWVDINESGVVACSGLTAAPGTTLLSGSSSPLTVIKSWAGTQFIRPQIAANGRIVCRVPSGDIVAFTHPFPNSDQVILPLAGAITATGLMPGISDDGQVVGYTATTAAGVGVFIAVSNGSTFIHRQLDGGGGPATARFGSVVLDSRVGVQRSVDGNIATVTIAYLAVDGAATRLCTAQARVESGAAGPLITTRRPRVAVSTGDTVGGTAIASLALFDPIGSRGFIVAGSTLADSSSAILRYSPKERPVNDAVSFTKWKQFDSPWGPLCVKSGQAAPCSGGSTFASQGCTLTSFATAAAAILQTQGVPSGSVTPLSVRAAAQRQGLINSTGGVSLPAATYTVATPTGGYARVSVQRSPSDTFDTIISELQAGRPVVLAVPSASNSADNTRANLIRDRVHYVVAYGYDPDAGIGESQGILINDPGFGFSRYGDPLTGLPLAGSVPGYTSAGADRLVHVTLHDYFAAMSRTATNLVGDYFGAWGDDPARDNERIRDWFNRGVFYYDDGLPGTVSTILVSPSVRERLIAKINVTIGWLQTLPPIPPFVTVCSPIELRIVASGGGIGYVTDSALAQPGDIVLAKVPELLVAWPDDLTPGSDPIFPPYSIELPVALAGQPLSVTLVGVGTGAYEVLYSPRDIRVQPAAVSGVATPTLVAQFPVPASSTSCGANPPSSLIVGGSSLPGGTAVFAATNPLATQPAAIGLFAFALTEDPAQPCGTPLPGFGMSGPGAVGELLVANIVNIVPGGIFTGPSQPSQFPLSIPQSPALSGAVFHVQAVLVDAAPGAPVPFGLTNAVRFEIGP